MALKSRAQSCAILSFKGWGVVRGIGQPSTKKKCQLFHSHWLHKTTQHEQLVRFQLNLPRVAAFGPQLSESFEGNSLSSPSGDLCGSGLRRCHILCFCAF